MARARAEAGELVHLFADWHIEPMPLGGGKSLLTAARRPKAETAGPSVPARP